MEVKTEKRNDVLKRQELSLEIESETNPTFSDIKKQLAEQFSKSEENVNVYSIKGSFGKNSFLIKADIYDLKEDLEIIKSLELSKKQRKEADDAAKKTKEEGEKAAEEVTEEKPEEASEENTTDKVSEKEPAEKVDSAPVEEKEPVEEAEEKPSEAPAEDKPEEEAKTISEEKQKEEESKE